MTDLPKPQSLPREGAAEHEASMGLGKFFRLLAVRLKTQGIAATLQWMFNVFNRLVLDLPIRNQCQVTPQLFVGPQFKQRGWRRLQQWGITGVVNLRRERDDLSLGVNIPHYLYLPTTDDDAPTIEDLDRGVAFIREQIERNGKVYIHCGAGVGRAPTMAAAYLIATGDTPQQAMKRIRAVRRFIRPTRSQIDQLQWYYELQKHTTGSN